MAEGKLMYHCSLALRLMSWTLVGKPMRKDPFQRYLVIQLDITNATGLQHGTSKLLLSSQWPKPSRWPSASVGRRRPIGLLASLITMLESLKLMLKSVVKVVNGSNRYIDPLGGFRQS